MIVHAINNDTFQNKTSGRLLASLDSANRNVSILLKKTRGVETKKRYNEVRKQITRIADDLRNKVESDIDVNNFLQQELDTLAEIYSRTTDLDRLNIPALSQVKNASTFIPYADNKNFDSFLKNVNEQFFNTWDSAVRTGYMTGMSSDEIIRTVVGSVAKNAQVAKSGTIETLKNSLLANVKTALQSFAIETQCQFYKSNEQYFDGYKWIATLDRRTCLVCGALDGKIFKTLDEVKNKPPMHLNCRCLLIANFDNEIEDARASENGRVDSNITYKDWLMEQNEEIQRQILGRVRYEMFVNGEDIGTFVNRDVIIPVKTLFFSEKTKTILSLQPQVDKELLNKVVAGLRRTGYDVQIGKETDNYLEKYGKEAVTMQSLDSKGIIIYHSKVSASGMFEEIIHTSQIRQFGFEYCKKNYEELEIEAKTKLLKNKKIYKITDFEETIIRKSLKEYREMLKRKGK